MFNGTTAQDIDLMAGFKNKKFVIADDYLGYGSTTVVLTDIRFWANIVEQLEQWVKECTPTAEIFGMTIDFKTREDLMLFVLKWA